MPQYLLSVHHPDGYPERTPDELQKAFASVGAFNEELQTSGAWVFAGGLQPQETATVLQVVDGEVVVTDGPYAETKEQMGGFWVIEAADLDEAMAWAGKATTACGDAVELRPFQGGPEA